MRAFVRVSAGLLAATAAILGVPGQAREEYDPDAVVPVHVTTIIRKQLERRVTVYGEIIPEPAGPGRPAARANLSSASGGLVAAVPVVEGQTIEKGAVVVELDSRQAEAEVEIARAAVVQATSEARRQARLAEHDDSSVKQKELAERQLAEARAALTKAQTARDYLDLRAPFSGTVVRVGVRRGEVVNAADPLVEMVDLGRLVAAVRVPAARLPEMRVGQTAVVEAGDREIEGHVVYVGSEIDPSNGTAGVRIALASSAGLNPGGFLRARVVVESRFDVLAVPVCAVVYGEDRDGTIAVVQDGRAHLSRITVGIVDGDWVEIAGEDIEAGTMVVTCESYGLPDDTPVRVIEEYASP